MSNDTQNRFLYLFERVGEPLSFSPRGRGNTQLMYDVPSSSISCPEVRDAAQITRMAFSSQTGVRRYSVQEPSQRPNLSNVARLCPRTSLYTYFNPQHREATKELSDVLMRQTTEDQLFQMASYCRDSPMINCKLWINAVAKVLLTHPQTSNKFQMPAAWEVMPDVFFNSFVMRQAFRQAEMPPQDRGIIAVDNFRTGRNTNPENRLAYFREDIGVNSHHWHWHLIYTLDGARLEGQRKGELFYYMHHAMLARYDAERLGLGLSRVKMLGIDDNPVLKEGYFGKLFDTNSGQNWGTRQNDTPLKNLNRSDDSDLDASYRKMTLEQLRRWRDRVMEAIDTGMVITTDNKRVPLNIDMLGDMIEASTLSPNPQFYGPQGVHNVGHVLISFCHDPDYKHIENGGPMTDTTTAMRDPIFYRWHKYIDMMFDTYKRTLQPYQDKGKDEDFPLAWDPIKVSNLSVQHTGSGARPNVLTTYFMNSNVDLSRGLDFLRTDMNKLGAIWLKFKHINHDAFNYSINVRNSGRSQLRATFRIYMAPRLNEHGEQFIFMQQRKLFFEMDKFVETLRPGDNTITRSSLLSSTTVPWEQTFRDLERNVSEPTPEQAICGCGWPQHMLLPRGTPSGQIFDLVVLLTDAEKDTVKGTTPSKASGNGSCRESLSFCGRLNQAYPDRKPMGYPFDRNPFTVPDPSNPKAQIPVEFIEQYVSKIPNMHAVQIRIVHDSSRVPTRQDGGPATSMMEINGDPTVKPTAPMCPDQRQRPSSSTTSTASSSSSSSTTTRPTSMLATPSSPSPPRSPKPTRPSWSYGDGRGSGGRDAWGSSYPSRGPNPNGYGGYGGRRPQSPSPPRDGWGSRPGSPRWGWGG